MKIIWTKLSVEKLEEIADYISVDNHASAKNWVIHIQKSANKLKDFPELGRLVPEIRRKDVRELIEGNYRVIYKKGNKKVTILTIRNSRQILNENNILKTDK